MPHKGQREAVWSLDILHYLFPNLHLILVGDGPERQETQRFAGLIGVTAECHFVGPVLDTRPYYQRADLVWITGRGEGINTMLEAMAAGKAIVTARPPAASRLCSSTAKRVCSRPLETKQTFAA